MKLSATPQPRISSKRSDDVSTDVHSMCYSRVSMLTHEVEKLSDVLCVTSQEMEIYRNNTNDLKNQLQDQQQQVDILNKEFDDVCEKLRTKTIEIEENAFKLQKQQLINSDLKVQVNKLVADFESMNAIIQQKDQELFTAKSQFINKTEELSTALQQTYHLENGLKQVREEKLKYINEYQIKEKELTECKNQIAEYIQYQQLSEQMKLDIDLIRRNYTDLLEQRQQEKISYEAQIDVLRQMSDFSLEDAKQKYQQLVEQEIKNYKQNMNQEIKMQFLNYESEIDTLRNNVSNLNLQLQNSELQNTTLKQNYNLYLQQETYERDQKINQLNVEIKTIQEMFFRVNQELEQWKKQLKDGEIIRYDQELEVQLNNQFEFKRKMEEIDNENQQLRKEMRLLKENNSLLQQQLKNQNNNSTLQFSQITPIQSIFPSSKINDTEKIKYLLKAVDQLQNVVKEKDQEILKLSTLTTTGNVSNRMRNSNTVFYHVNTTELSQMLKQ